MTNTNNLFAWDPSNGLEAGDISTGKHVPYDFAFSRDGELVAYYCILKKTVVVQRTAGDVAPIATFAHEHAPFDLCIAPDASFVVGMMQKPPEIYFYDIEEQQLRPFSAGESTMFSMALSPDGTTLVTGYVRQFRVWDMRDANERKRVDDFTFTVSALAFSPDGAALAVGHAVGQNPAKGVISIYDTATWAKTADIAAHDLYPTRLRFSPNGELLASGSFDGSVKLWHVDGWKLRGELTDHKGKPIDNLEFSPDSQRLATTAYPDTRITPVSKPPLGVEAK
jgi:WD40 repeat protein